MLCNGAARPEECFVIRSFQLGAQVLCNGAARPGECFVITSSQHGVQVLCNGAARPEDWRGHVADLQLALTTMEATGQARDVLVLDANLFFWPAFPLQVRPLLVWASVLAIRCALCAECV